MNITLHFLLICCLLAGAVPNGKDSNNDLKDLYADCKFISSNGTIFQQLCLTALFSVTSFKLKAPTVYIEDDLCSNFDVDLKSAKGKIGIAKRGVCSFDQKAMNAEKMGLSAVIVVNHQSDIFPMGASNSDMKLNIPVLMVGNSSKIDDFLKSCTAKENNFISIIKGC
jgi:hypothetical protein